MAACQRLHRLAWTFLVLSAGFVMIQLVGCAEESPSTARRAHPDTGLEAIPERKFHKIDEKDRKVVTTSSGLKYEDQEEGLGAVAQPGDTVIVHYTGWLRDGKKFDSSFDHGQPLRFPLGARRVIKGWDEGVAGMKEGGKRKLIIPPDLGYGARGAGRDIPPNAELTFEVELLKIE
jgi:FKBP-type peptidyl-prolyl cis-trans isomerase FkpA